MSNLEVGAWVTQYSAGYWQIVDLKPKYAEEDRAGRRKGDLIGQWALLKKGFTPKMKFRLDCETVDASWCKPINDEQMQSITQYFEGHPEEHRRFEEQPFFERPAITTNWLNLSPEEVLRFQEALASFPAKFTGAEIIDILKERNLSSCFSTPPANYLFHCKHILWELNPDYEPLYYDPILISNQDHEK